MLAVLAEAAPVVAPGDAALAAEIAEAGRAVAEATAPLAVVGGEGQGKSTFVDALLGADVVPREFSRPGTVAPVLVRWGPADRPTYAVSLDAAAEPVPCAGPDEFRRYLLQRYNPDNGRRVAAGIVEYRHEVLESGLELVDMPGVEGLSTTVQKQLTGALGGARRAILVLRERGHGPAGRILQRYPDLTVEAVVVNVWEDDWITGDPAAHVAEFRAAASGGELGVEFPADRVFVLHLPSLCRHEPRPDGPAAVAAHRAEAARFAEWWRGFLAREAAAAPLDAAAASVSALAERVGGLARRRAGTLSALAARDPAALKAAQAAATAWARNRRRRWAGRAGKGAVDKATAAHWEAVRSRLAELRDTLTGAAGSARRLAGRITWTDDALPRSLAREVRPRLTAGLTRFERACAVAARAATAQFQAEADAMVGGPPPEAPFHLGPLPRAEAPKAYMFVLHPPGVAPSGFLATMSARRHAQQLADEYAERAGRIDTTVASGFRDGLRSAVAEAAEAVGQTFTARARELRTVAANPDDPRFATARQTYDDLVRRIDELARRMGEEPVGAGGDRLPP